MGRAELARMITVVAAICLADAAAIVVANIVVVVVSVAHLCWARHGVYGHVPKVLQGPAKPTRRIEGRAAEECPPKPPADVSERCRAKSAATPKSSRKASRHPVCVILDFYEYSN